MIVFAVSTTQYPFTEYVTLHPPQTAALSLEIRARDIRMAIHTLDNLMQGIASEIGFPLWRLKERGIEQEDTTIQWLAKLESKIVLSSKMHENRLFCDFKFVFSDGKGV